jgi:hypothetical protein
MRGGLKLADRGVIPRLLSGVFRRGKKIMKDSDGQTTVQVALSYYEIYNDKVFDLLEPPDQRTPSGLPLRAEANGRTVVAGLTERACSDLRDFEKMYIEANNNRVTAATKLNAHSSRSHAILRVKLVQTTGEYVRESTASAIDLAGSEDNRRTDNGKERLVESAAINKSLFVLSQCIDAIGRGDKRIPYRESKMTRILSLGQNNGITVMILNLAPLRSYHLDTLSSLNVSSRAKRIEVREIENEVVFKQFPKKDMTISGISGLRQPLRALTNAHNVHNGNIAAKATETKAAAADVTRPIKAFDVYTDKVKAPSNIGRPSLGLIQNRRISSFKRPSEDGATLRPAKIPRPSIGGASSSLSSSHITSSNVANSIGSIGSQQQTITVSAADIEAMVEKKVGEILAARSAAEKEKQEQLRRQTLSQPDMHDEVTKRLDALERRIVHSPKRQHDTKSDGLRYLLAAKQSKMKGDHEAALRMYEMALPFFPGQTKLVGKIERLRARLGRGATEQQRGRGRRHTRDQLEETTVLDDDDDTVAGVAAGEESFADARARFRSRAPLVRAALTTLQEEAEESSPPSPEAINSVEDQLRREYGALLA